MEGVSDIAFGSGAGLFLSKDLVRLLIDKQNMVDSSLPRAGAQVNPDRLPVEFRHRLRAKLGMALPNTAVGRIASLSV